MMVLYTETGGMQAVRKKDHITVHQNLPRNIRFMPRTDSENADHGRVRLLSLACLPVVYQ